MVFVVDDDASVRTALGRLLKSHGFRFQGFASAEAFLEEDRSEAPACLVLDVSMPGLDGLDLQQALAKRNATLPIVFITGHGDIPMSVKAMKAGAVDFLPKPFDNQALLKAVRQAITLHARSREAAAACQEVRRRFESLSPREREVMALVVGGRLNKQVGHQLGVAEKTIKVHRSRVMHKMHADSLPALVCMAQTLGIEIDQP
jgi:FixJ family two-component response regulator